MYRREERRKLRSESILSLYGINTLGFYKNRRLKD